MSAAALPAVTEQLALVAALRPRTDGAGASRLGMSAVLLEHEAEVLSNEFGTRDPRSRAAPWTLTALGRRVRCCTGATRPDSRTGRAGLP
jgi:hypothetical protein